MMRPNIKKTEGLKRTSQENFLNFNDKTKDKFVTCFYENYDFLRVINRINFLDYNLIKAEKSYTLRLHKKCLENNLFFTRETYNTKKIHTHNLFITVNDKRVYPTESSNEDLKFINECYKIEIANNAHQTVRKILKAFSQENNGVNKKIFKSIDKFNNNFKIYCLFLKNYYIDEYGDYLTDVISKSETKSKLNSLEEIEIELNLAILKLKRNVKRKEYKLRANLARLYYASDLLVNSRNEQCITFNIPEDFSKIDGYPIINLKINTEELFSGFIDEKKNNRLRSYFTGESTEFLLRIIKTNGSSVYHEIIPPEKTIITKVTTPTEKREYNVMMQDFNRSSKNRIPFIDGFNERLVIHTPRKLKKERKNGSNKSDLEKYPRLFMTLRPFKSLQLWILASLILGISYNGLLIYILGHTTVNHLVFHELVLSDFLTSLIEIVRFQGPWIYSLIIGNQIWLQRPRFLWKKTTKLSIAIILIGTLLLMILIFYNNFLQSYIIPDWNTS